MSKTALLGSLAAALLVSGCAMSGPSLLPGFWVMLDSPDDDQQDQAAAGDDTEAKTTKSDDGDDADKDSAKAPASKSEQAK